MSRLIIGFIATALVFVALDFVWLSQTGPTLYAPRLGGIVLATPRIGPAVAFYLVYLLGLVWFGVRAGLRQARWSAATLNGALFGLCAYATYDLTNQATLKVWPAEITGLDLAWGAFASGMASTVGYLLTRALKPQS